jgi:cytochrome b561
VPASVRPAEINLNSRRRTMSPLNKKSQYNIAKLLHWLVALIVLLMLMSGWRTETFELEDKQFIMMIHSALGTTVFILMACRWWWRKSHNLYAPVGWYKKPFQLLQWTFYPLLLLQPVLGFLQSIFIDYEVLAFGFINYSAIAASNEAWHGIFHQLHMLTAVLLILIFFAHLVEKTRKFFIDDSNSMREP